MPTIATTDVTIIASSSQGDFATLAGREGEFRLGPWQADMRMTPQTLVIREETYDPDDPEHRLPPVAIRVREAVAVPPGSHKTVMTRAQRMAAASREKASTPVVVDLLATSPLLRPTPARALALGKANVPVMVADGEPAKTRATGAYIEAQPAKQGPAAIIAAIEQATHGTIHLVGDQLVLIAPPRANPDAIDLLVKAEPLLLAYKRDGSAACQVTPKCKRTAVTLAAPRALWCGECAPKVKS